MKYIYELEGQPIEGNIELPIVLNCGSQFEHESGRYKVIQIVPFVTADITIFNCAYIDNTQHLTDQLRKGKQFSYSKPVNN